MSLIQYTKMPQLQIRAQNTHTCSVEINRFSKKIGEAGDEKQVYKMMLLNENF